MKNLSRLFFVAVLLLSFSTTNAQDKNNPWAVSLGVNAVDLYPVGEDLPQGPYFDEYFNVTDHWNILPSISRVAVSRYLSDGFTFTAAGSFNRIDKFGTNRDAITGEETTNRVDDLTYYAIDGLVSYSFKDVIKSKRIDPFLGLGGGYTWVDDIGAGTLNGTLGLKYWIGESVALEFQSTYKHSFEDFLSKHFQHSLGVVFKFGGTDTDGDGIYDYDDACPEEAGLEAFNGCPDSDGDGIQDSKDDCPYTSGLAEFNGCPDTDGDGVIDKDDKCPNVAGQKGLQGCPDADGDGIADGEDNCPNTAGPSANKGCPWPDTDGDGILDKDDKCPNTPGVAAEQGCPEVKSIAKDVEATARLNQLAKTVYFKSGKDSFTDATYETLDAIVQLLKSYPADSFHIEGHTDSVGSKSLNQRLSEQRANAVKTYFEGKLPNSFTAEGYGEDKPIAPNTTRAGKAKNRRVEIKLKS